MRIAAFILFAAIAAPSAQADTSPYAGEQPRAIKALASAEIENLRAGRGMGLAKAAELNSFPGPAHVLELADRLNLSAEQRARTAALMRDTQADAQRIGAAVIAAEQALDRAFAERRIDDGALRAQLTEIASLQGELRYVHLRTHLAQTAILTPAQVRQYDVLRGYATQGAAPAHGPGGHGSGKH